MFLDEVVNLLAPRLRQLWWKAAQTSLVNALLGEVPTCWPPNRVDEEGRPLQSLPMSFRWLKGANEALAAHCMLLIPRPFN